MLYKCRASLIWRGISKSGKTNLGKFGSVHFIFSNIYQVFDLFTEHIYNVPDIVLSAESRAIKEDRQGPSYLVELIT